MSAFPTLEEDQRREVGCAWYRLAPARFQVTGALPFRFAIMDKTMCRRRCSSAVEDHARSYEIDGIMWGSERQGAFANAAAASSKSAPDGTRDAVAAALRAGADGVLLARKCSEMKLANLRGAGAANQAFAG